MAEFREFLAQLIAIAVKERRGHESPAQPSAPANGHLWPLGCGLCQLVTPSKETDPRILRTLAYLERAWPHPDSLRVIASGVGLSVSRLSHIFKRDVGMTIGQVVLALKLAYAVVSLSSADRRVSEICQDIGICHSSNLDHLFRKYLGQSPSRLRRSRSLVQPTATVGEPFIATKTKK